MSICCRSCYTSISGIINHSNSQFHWNPITSTWIMDSISAEIRWIGSESSASFYSFIVRLCFLLFDICLMFWYARIWYYIIWNAFIFSLDCSTNFPLCWIVRVVRVYGWFEQPVKHARLSALTTFQRCITISPFPHSNQHFQCSICILQFDERQHI